MIKPINQSTILVVDITKMWKQLSQYGIKKFQQRKCSADPTEKQNPIMGEAHCCKNTDLSSEIFKKYNLVAFENAVQRLSVMYFNIHLLLYCFLFLRVKTTSLPFVI